MRRALLATALLTFAVSPPGAWGQFGGFGGRGRGMGGQEEGRFAPAAPRLPGVELDGPADSATAQAVLDLNAEQAARYGQAYDSFMVATRPQRDSVRVAVGKMNDRLDSGDRAAALFYAERVQDLGKYLKDRQDKFEDNLHHFLTGDQVKGYRRWKEDQMLALPIVLLFAFTALSDVYAEAIAKYPNVIGITLVMEAIGALWIRRIVNFDF